MAEYINRREAEQRISDLINITMGRCPTWEEVHEALYDLLVVELVWCKDCKYCKQQDGKEPWLNCLHLKMTTTPYWFCADGVKKE